MDVDSFLPTVLGSATAGLVARVLCHPMDTVKSRLQSGQATGMRSFDWREVRALYRGIGAVVVGGVPGVCLYMTSYEMTKGFLSAQPVFRDSSFTTYFTAGMVAEAVCCVVFVPVDVVKERLQVQFTSKDCEAVDAPARRWVQYRGSFDALMQISRTEGIRGVYKGYGATLLSYGPFSALYFFLYEEAKKRALASLPDPPTGKRDTLPFWHTLGCAAVAGGVASAVTNPLDLAKVRLQVEVATSSGMNNGDVPGSSSSKRTLLSMLRKVYRHEGLRGLWRGSFARVLFHTPSTAITMALFERFKELWGQQLDKRKKS